MEARLERLRHAAPGAVIPLVQRIDRAADVHGDGLRLRGGHVELDAQVGINLREFTPVKVGGGADRFGDDTHDRALAGGHQGQHRQGDKDQMLFHDAYHLKSFWAYRYRLRRQVSHSWAVRGDW